jgi:hypothetical protein
MMDSVHVEDDRGSERCDQEKGFNEEALDCQY